MKCLHHTAFWLATFASSLFGFATFLPLWLGRITNSGTRFYALWYQLQCSENSCAGDTMMFENENVDGEYNFEVIILPMCALIAAICSFIGVLLIEILSCDCGRRIDCNPRPVMVFCTIVFWIATVFSGLAFFISIVICFEFYKNNTITHAAEFPWCTLLFGIGFILMFIAAILFSMILCKWERHGMFYGPTGGDWAPLDYTDSVGSGTYSKSGGSNYRESAKFVDNKSRLSDVRSSYSDSIKRSFRETPRMPIRESTKVPGLGGMSSYIDSGYDRPLQSDIGMNRSSTYFDFRLGNSKKSSLYSNPMKASSVNDLRQSKKNIHDSPSILRNTKASEYIREERNSVRESRKIPKDSSADEIDPKRLSTGFTRFRESRGEKMSDEGRF